MFLLIMTTFVQCKKQKVTRLFHVNELSLYIQINEIGKNRYRIYINKAADQLGEDYIDVSYWQDRQPAYLIRGTPPSIDLHIHNDVDFCVIFVAALGN